MGVRIRAAVSGEVLEAQQIPSSRWASIKAAACADSTSGSLVAALPHADDGVGGIDVQIDDGSQIHVYATAREQSRRGRRLLARGLEISALAELLSRRRRRKVVELFETANLSTLLADGNEEGQTARTARRRRDGTRQGYGSLQGASQRTHLLEGNDVAKMSLAAGAVDLEHDDTAKTVLGDVVDAPESHQQLGDLGFMTTGPSELSSST